MNSDNVYENVHEGALYIDTNNGVISFLDKAGNRLLRVTHLPDPIPANTSIDIVSIPALTSYTPLTQASEML